VSAKKWRWINKRLLEALHGESLVRFGGANGLRDMGLFESALARPQQLAHYGKPDYADLAACYAFGLAQNHPFIDGNKRVAFLSLGLFLGLNGYRLIATQVDAAITMLALAGGELDEKQLADWVRRSCIKFG
jgi:death on curing protein